MLDLQLLRVLSVRKGGLRAWKPGDRTPERFQNAIKIIAWLICEGWESLLPAFELLEEVAASLSARQDALAPARDRARALALAAI